MDRMRDRLDKIARLSRSAPAGSSDAFQPTPARPSIPTRQSASRQGKAPIPRSPATLPPASRRPVSLPAARHSATPTPRTPIGASSERLPATSTPPKVGALPTAPAPAQPATPRGTSGTLASSSTTRTPGHPADVRAANTSAPQADALDTDRILELPARVTIARKQRPTAGRADATLSGAPDPSDSYPNDPPRVVPLPARKRAAPATPTPPADVATPDLPPPVALPVRPASARTPAPNRNAPSPSRVGASAGRPPASPIGMSASSGVGALPAVPAAAENRQAANHHASDNHSLPENIESVGGAMQRFLAVLAERRRQRTLGGGNGGDPPQPPSSASENICPVCGGAGYVRLDVPVGDPRFGQPVPCKCKEREFEERRRMEEERRVLELDRFFSLKPFGDKTFESFNPRVAGVKEAYEAAQTFAEDPTGAPFRWLVLMGGTGVGKTHLAAAIAHERLEARSSVFFAVVPDLLDHLRAAFAPSAEMPYNEMFETVREVEMLILDDLGSENSTAWATEKLFQIINYRYNFRMPTVITTNSRLFEHMDERIASRLADTSLSRTVVIEAQSRRPHPARKQAPPGRQAPPRW